MRSSRVHIYVLLLAVIGVTKDVAGGSALDYVTRDTSLIADVRDALKGFDLNPYTSAEQIGFQIMARATKPTKLKHVYESLAVLSKKKDVCAKPTVLSCLTIMSLGDLEPFVKYVENSREKFIACAESRAKEVEQKWNTMPNMRPMNDYLPKINEALAKLGKGDDSVSSGCLAQLLRGQVRGKVEKVMDDLCRSLDAKLQEDFAVLNLGKTLGYKFTEKLDAMNNFMRACAAWQDSDTKAAILANILC